MKANTLLCLYDGGWREVINQDGIDTAGRRIEKSESLTRVTTPEQVDTVGGARLAELVGEQWHFRYQIEPGNGEVPYADVVMGATVLAPNQDGTLVSQRVIGCTVTKEDGGTVYTPEVGTYVRGSEELLSNHLARLAPGALGGRSDSAQPNDARQPRQERPLEPDPWLWSLGDESTALSDSVGFTSASYKVRSGMLISRLDGNINGPDGTSTDATIDLYIDDVLQVDAQLVIPAGGAPGPEATVHYGAFLTAGQRWKLVATDLPPETATLEVTVTVVGR